MNSEPPFENLAPRASDGRTARGHARREERRAQILAVAVEVFSERGYHQTSVADLIDAAGVARGTFYLYFESKSTIFLELLSELMDRLRASVVGVDTTPGAPPLTEQLRATVERLLAALERDRAIITILLREAVGLDAEVDARLSAFYEHLHGYIQESLRNGQAMGVVRACDTDVVATCILGTVREVVERAWLRRPELPLDAAATAAAIVDFNSRAVLIA